MMPEERADRLSWELRHLWEAENRIKLISDVIREAEQAVREECAQVADTYCESAKRARELSEKEHWAVVHLEKSITAECIAQDIRALGDQS